jgi:hypothetical protein
VHLRLVLQRDAAVDRLDVASDNAAFDGDAAIDRLQVAVLLAGLGGDAAI